MKPHLREYSNFSPGKIGRLVFPDKQRDAIKRKITTQHFRKYGPITFI
jgi:hypothetical protein